MAASWRAGVDLHECESDEATRRARSAPRGGDEAGALSKLIVLDRSSGISRRSLRRRARGPSPIRRARSAPVLLEVVDADDEEAPKRLRDEGAYRPLRA